MIQRSLVILKPDSVKRGLTGEIIRRIERTGLKILTMKMIWIDKDFGKKHYFDVEERHGKKVFSNLIDYITEGPVIAICFEGVEAIANIRKIVGSTYPDEALPGTIRGDYCLISKVHANKYGKRVGNLIHASANEEEAEQEIRLWFSVEDLHEYKRLDEEETR